MFAAVSSAYFFFSIYFKEVPKSRNSLVAFVLRNSCSSHLHTQSAYVFWCHQFPVVGIFGCCFMEGSYDVRAVPVPGEIPFDKKLVVANIYIISSLSSETLRWIFLELDDLPID
jgi:hypothetical protein